MFHFDVSNLARRFWPAMALIPALAAGSAHAQDSAAVFAGGYVGDNSSAYAGALVPLPGATLGKGLAIRATASAGQYDYIGSRKIDADYTSVEALAAYQFSGAWGYANLAAGPRFTRTNLSPSDPGSKREGSRWDAYVSADGAPQHGALAGRRLRFLRLPA